MKNSSDNTKPGRILIVSNRLPVSVVKTETGLEYHASAGGLATGLRALHGEIETLWVGWPGSVQKQDRAEAEKKLIGDFACHPVFIADKLADRYYEGYSNRTIWPLFHSFPALTKYSASEWEAYKKANALFADQIVKIFRPGDTLWIHDYHLMLLPGLLRERIPEARMGFFLHIPFPHFDVFQLLPQHQEILQHLLALDLIGFHTHDYAQSFLGSVRRLLGYDNTLGQLMVGNRVLQVDVFPMGVDFEKFSCAAHDPNIRNEVEKIRKRMSARKTVFSVSRLDYTKGIPESLEAIKEFFDRYPEWHEKVVFVLVVVPSRERVELYASLKRTIDEMVGQIVSTYGTLGWTPVRYIYRSLTEGELIGLYACADVAFVTPSRDGMNLIAKEFLSVRSDERGVLVLSQLAGAAKELQEAIIVNPNSKEEMAVALNLALTMPEDEQRERMVRMRARLKTHDIHAWVQRFFHRLREVSQISDALKIKVLEQETEQEIGRRFKAAKNRLFVLDYDGTLVPFADTPSAAQPDVELLEMLDRLSAHPENKVVILSGRDRNTLDRWLGHLNLMLVAEHGGWMREERGEAWRATITPKKNGWKKDIRPIFELFVDRIPASFMEEKDFSLVWHYRQANEESASLAAKELLDTLSNFSRNLGIQVLPGNKAIEVRNVGISKGAFFSSFLSPALPEFILAVGDDWTDEDLFEALPEAAYSIKVGMRMSKARFNLKSHLDVRSLLKRLRE